MNYNSVQDIISAGITNMTVRRNNSSLAYSNSDSVACPSWLTLNGKNLGGTLYYDGYASVGSIGKLNEIRPNYKASVGRVYYCYTEEGTLYGTVPFFKIRLRAACRNNTMTSTYELTFDVLFVYGGDFEIYLAVKPTTTSTSYIGTHTFINGSNTFTLTWAAPQHISFYSDGHGNYTMDDGNILVVRNPNMVRYLLGDEDGNVYTVRDGAAVLVGTELTSALFQAQGVDTIPPASVIETLTRPQLYYWNQNESAALPQINATLYGIPFPQTVTSNRLILGDASIVGVSEVTCEYKGEPLVALSFDDGPFRYYDGSAWADAGEANGMTPQVLLGIQPEAWSELVSGVNYAKIRVTLNSVVDAITSIVFTFITR